MLSGYSDDKTRFEKMLALYKKNASKFSTSEINDLNEVFELGKEFFGVDVELPVVKKEVANGLERDPLRPNFQKDLLKLVGEEFNCQAFWESKNPKPFETVSIQDAKYLEARWDNTGKTIGIRVKLPTKQFVDIQYIMNAVNREEVYAQFSEKFKKILDKMGIGENLTIYPTTYGIGTFIAFGNRGNIGKKLNEVLDKAGISYTNEYSDAHYVYRYKISKSQENIKKLDKFLQDASLNDSLSGYSDDKTRFETMLALYKKNASKFSTSEINDLNEVFELGKEFFGVDVELPVVKKQKKFVCAPTRNTTVETPQRSIPAVYSIVELTDLITSNTPHNFKPDPRYPDKCQQRDYLTDKSEQEKVRVGAKHFNPAIVINNAPTASDGPAIVNNKHFVLGGNGRTMMMKLLSKEKYSEYLEKLKCDLDIFGLTANDLKGYIQPCLVREVDMKVQECALFSNILNQNLTQDIDLVTKTVSFARQLSETDIKHIAMLFENTDSDTLASMLSDKKVVSKLQEIFRSAGIITAQNTSKWLVDSHIFTNEGKLATEGILLGTVLENKNLIEAARSFTEKIIRTIPLLLRMKNLPKEWNMIDDIQNVVKLEYERRKMNVPIDDYIDQISFDKPDVKEKEELVWKVIAEGSWLKWKNFLDKYVKMGEDAQELEASGGGMFGETVKPMDAIRRLSGMKNSLNDLLSGYSDDNSTYQKIFDTIETKKHEEKDVLALSDFYDQPPQSFPTIPSGVGRELGNLFARAPQRSFVRLMQNAGVANVAIRLLRQQNIITDENKSAWITDSVTFTPNGITLLKEGLWKLLFPHTLTSDYPEQVTDKILKNLSAFLQLKSNGTLFLQFEIALELGKDWNNDGRTFEEYCSATIFDNPLDAQEFAVLCPILWEMNNDKFDYILQQYVKSYAQSDRATFLRNLSTEIGTRVSRQKTHSLSDVYIWK